MRFIRLMLAACLTFISSVVFAQTQPWDLKKFDEALSQGKPVAVFFHADWCPTCHKQEKVTKEILKDPMFQKMMVFMPDYDSTEKLKQFYRVTRQSTLIVFKAGKEVSRSVGQTDMSALKAELSKAL